MRLHFVVHLALALAASSVQAQSAASSSASTQSMDKPTIFYVYDALCGWCYGFSPVMKTFYENHRDQYDFIAVSGGMITGDRIGPIGVIAPYIKNAYKTVEEYSGVRFGEPFLNQILEEGSAIFSSEPAALAMAVFRAQYPERTVEFAHVLQQAIYRDGIQPTDLTQYGPYAAQFGFDPQAFVGLMNQAEARESAQRDYRLAQQLGVSGFPTVILLHGDTLQALARGYTTLDTLEAALDKATK